MSEAQDRDLQPRIRTEWQWMQDHEDEERPDQGALDHLVQTCGQTQAGDCLIAGSAYCEFACPFQGELFGADAAAEPEAGEEEG